MNATNLAILLVLSFLVINFVAVEGICFFYTCQRQCVYDRQHGFAEEAFRHLWQRVCPIQYLRAGYKACCVTFGQY